MKITRRTSAITLSDYEALLRKHGYKFVDEGADANVFISRDRKHVVKVGYVNKNRAYVEYLKNISRMKLAWVPKVYEVTVYTPDVYNVGAPFVVVTMERLYPLWESKSRAASDTAEILDSCDLTCATVDEIEREMHRLNRRFDQPGFLRVMAAARDVVRDIRGCRLDIHSGNIMVRKLATGHQMVLTDPVHEALPPATVMV